MLIIAIICLICVLCVILYRIPLPNNDGVHDVVQNMETTSTPTKGRISVYEYTCLIRNIETEIKGKIIQLIKLEPDTIYFVSFDKVGKAYKVVFEKSTLKPVSIKILGNKVLSPSEIDLYIKGVV